MIMKKGQARKIIQELYEQFRISIIIKKYLYYLYLEGPPNPYSKQLPNMKMTDYPPQPKDNQPTKKWNNRASPVDLVKTT